MKQVILITMLLAAVCLFIGCGSSDSEHDDNHEHTSDGEQAALPEGANPMCPILTDEKADASLFVEHEGKNIYVCCKKCLKRVKEDPVVAYAKAYPDQGHDEHQH